MKRVRVAPGKFVMISDELAKKAAEIRMPTKEEFRALPAEPEVGTGLLAGSKRLHRRRPK
ncbi:hypothetical protein ACTJKJ_08775 [Roseateles sp. 22389]|uniref:hypothetical protein n=1 Tax=Roseateles sp. 22389 TaxID=3453916 RepID=UPI003F82996D